MAKIRNFSLTQELVDELVAVVWDQIPDEDLIEWARASLPGSFTKPDMIRQRLEARIKSDAPLNEATLALLGHNLPSSLLVSALAPEVIKDITPELTILVGQGEWALALLLDRREEVQKQGIELAGQPHIDISEQDFADAEASYLEFVEAMFYDPIEVYPEQPSSQETALPPEILEKLHSGAINDLNTTVQKHRERIEHLSNELHQQRLRHEAKLRDQAHAFEKERKQLRAEINDEKAKWSKAIAERQAAEKKLSELTTQFEGSVAAKVREQVSGELRKWLESPTQTEATVSQIGGKGADVIARAEAALQAQAAQDRHTGNRLQLEGHLERLLTMRKRLADCFNAAIRPLPEVKKAMLELEAEIERCQRTLHRAETPSELQMRLLSAINEAADWDALRVSSNLLDQLADASLLHPEERRALFSAMDRKLSLLAETGKAKPAEVESGWALRDYLYRNRSALLILDGHNVLYGLPEIFSPYYEDGHPRRAAREALTEMTGRLVLPRPNIQARICFDGPMSDARRPLPNLEVIYSGGTGEHRADELIISQIQFKDLQSLDQKVFVVSDDRVIRREILRTGARFVRTDVFAVLLEDFNCTKLRD